MGDHFVLLLSESTLEAAIGKESQLEQSLFSKTQDNMISSREIDVIIKPSPSKSVECRICHDEDDDLNMETPCSCRGSLKYAHRKCVQRWCNEKGDTNCEICHQQFKPGYTAPPPLLHNGSVPMNLRGNWEIPGRDLNNPQFFSMVTSDHEYTDTDFDEFPAPSPRNLMCGRIVAIIFMVLLVLRHTLPIILYGAGEYSMTLFMLLVLRTIGVLLPVYIMARAFTAIQRRRHPQATQFPLSSSDEESELPHSRPRLVQVQ